MPDDDRDFGEAFNDDLDTAIHEVVNAFILLAATAVVVFGAAAIFLPR